MLAHYVCGTPTIDSILNANPAPLNSDNRNYLEFAFAKSLGTFIEFSIEDLRRKALEFNDHLPFAIQDSTAEKVRRRTIASYAVLGSYVPTIAGLTDDDQLLSDGINFYLGGNYEEAALRLTISNVDDNCPIERVTAAHAYSVTNREIPKEWLNRIYDFRRCEALAIQSTVYCKQGSWQACLETLKLFFEEMQKDPWGTSQVLRQAYQNAITIAKVNPIFATEIAKILSQRWAVYRDEEMRQILRYRVAVYGSDEDLLTAIESYEPYPLWIEEFLERRAELYQRSNHELRGRATKDIARYRLQYEIGDR